MGAEVFCDTLNVCESYKLRNGSSVFQAEIFAVEKAIDLLVTRNNEVNGPVSVYVDSQVVLKAL